VCSSYVPVRLTTELTPLNMDAESIRILNNAHQVPAVEVTLVSIIRVASLYRLSLSDDITLVANAFAQAARMCILSGESIPPDSIMNF
jgi:hypothetical protein